ncbi:MAG: MMPL family transporter [Acidimicrobiales bacterium]
MLNSLGRFCHDSRRTVALAWVGLIVLLAVLTATIGNNYGTGFETPDGDATEGFDLLDQYFGGRGSGTAGQIVFSAVDVTSDEVRAPMSAFFAVLEDLDNVQIVSPYSELAQGQINPQSTVAYATLEGPLELSQSQVASLGKSIRDLGPTIDGVRIEYGSDLFVEFAPPESEVLGLAFAIFILIAAFGSVLAMGLPIGTALAGIGSGAMVMGLTSQFIDMPEFAPTLGVMIGLGVGIDYALFIVTRFREELHAGATSSQAAAIAIDTAGRAVLFAGITVVISLLGMLIIGLAFVSGMAIGASITVMITMIASVTLLPALLGFAGDRVEVTRRRGLIAASMVALALVGIGIKLPEIALVAIPVAVIVLIAGFFVGPLKQEVKKRETKPVEQTFSYRWSRLIQRYPWPFAILGTLILLFLTIPVLSLRLGFSDTGNLPDDTTARQAYDLLAEGFGPGFNGPLLLVAEAGSADRDELLAITETLQATEGVAFATPPVPNSPEAPEAVLWQVIPETSPQAAATSDLVKRLRDEVLPQTSIDVKVTGSVAIGIDFSEHLARRIPVFFGAVLALSFMLLMVVFRSVLVPLKAVIMNLLSIGAAYGIIVAVFQWGWLVDLVGVGKGGPIEPFIPMMMFAIVFGLSMDYEVFLLSRVREEYDRTGDNATAVADGLASTARVITAAAAIMVFVFGSFLLETDRIIKLFGSGLAIAIFLDASIVRMLLVPATMELLGDRNWWLPAWLDRLLPKLDVEGGHHDSDSATDDKPDPERQLVDA